MRLDQLEQHLKQRRPVAEANVAAKIKDANWLMATVMTKNVNYAMQRAAETSVICAMPMVNQLCGARVMATVILTFELPKMAAPYQNHGTCAMLHRVVEKNSPTVILKMKSLSCRTIKARMTLNRI